MYGGDFSQFTVVEEELALDCVSMATEVCVFTVVGRRVVVLYMGTSQCSLLFIFKVHV